MRNEKYEPKSARANKDTWALWKFCQNLKPEEIMVLITKRKNELKYEKDTIHIKNLRREIKILEDTYAIVVKRRK